MSSIQRFCGVTIVFALAISFSIFIYFELQGIAYGGGGTDAIAGTLLINHYCVFSTNVDTGGIAFGGSTGFNPGTNTIGTVNSIGVTNSGNLASNILTSGSNWNYLSNSFYVTNTVWSGTANSVWSPVIILGGANEIRLTGASVDTRVTVNSISPNSIWLGVSIPAGQAPGIYTQTINVISNC
jgi:hypothetical protein